MGHVTGAITRTERELAPEGDETAHTHDVEEVPVEETFALRTRVLRADRTDLEVRMEDDERPGAFHLAVRGAQGVVVGVVTLTPEEPPFAARPPSYRLRQMAVLPARQGAGAGSALFAAAVTRLRALGVATLWAESRISSLDFYLRRGMEVVPGRAHNDLGVAYEDVVMDLGDPVNEPAED